MSNAMEKAAVTLFVLDNVLSNRSDWTGHSILIGNYLVLFPREIVHKSLWDGSRAPSQHIFCGDHYLEINECQDCENVISIIDKSVADIFSSVFKPKITKENISTIYLSNTLQECFKEYPYTLNTLGKKQDARRILAILEEISFHSNNPTSRDYLRMFRNRLLISIKESMNKK